jgi:hypothetical protein
MQWHVINIHTGIETFVTDPLSEYTNSDLSFYDWGAQISNGILYTTGYSGVLVAFNVTTGAHLWTFSQINPGLQQPSGTWPTFGTAGIVADGKIYWGLTQHSPGTPLFRGYNIYCIDAFTGQELWQLPGFFPTSSMAVANGEVVGYAGYDNQIYAFGTGQSGTTVSATPGLNNAITIQGTVTDQSPGTTAYGPAAGTPAISDDYMNLWMAYLYQQQAEPTNATGVTVTLTALDPNNNIEPLGNATSDITGHYSISFTPPVPGMYTITATFAGTHSYYASSAETSINVGTVQSTPTVAPSTAPLSNADTYFVPAVIGIIVVIIVGFALLFLALRKRA